MKKSILALVGASMATVVLATAVAAAGPAGRPAVERVRAHDTTAAVLGLTQEQVMELRHDGLSLAQIAERQKVDPQQLVQALVAQWTERIDARVANGAITPERATELKSQLLLTASTMVDQTAVGGMHGAAVGAGSRATTAVGARALGAGGRTGTGHGGYGTGTCDGSGRR